MRILPILLLIFISSLGAKPWGVHAIVRDPQKGMIYLQWFDEVGQGEKVMVQEKGGGKAWEEVPKESEYGSKEWHFYRLELTLRPGSVWKVQMGEEEVFVKTPPKGLPLKIAIGGDMMGMKGRFQRMNEVVREENPDFVVMGGDLAYALGGVSKNLFKTAISQWESFFAIAAEGIRDSDGVLIPWIVVVGNHDYRKDKAGGLFLVFFHCEGEKAKRVVDFQGLSIFALDTGHVEPIEGKQTEWLEKELGLRNEVPWKIAAYHIGAYPAYYSMKGKIPEKIRTLWSPLFESGGVIATFEHHSHCYKRTYPLIAGKIDPAGVTYFGDGCWGVRPRKYTFDAEHFVKAAKVNHVFIVDVVADHLHVKAVNDEGTVFDGAKYMKKGFKKS